jgi:hypothetical protein
MSYQVLAIERRGTTSRHINIDRGDDGFLSFPAEVGNPNYESFLASQSLTDAEVQAMEPDVWHDMV